jgi:hypothetical protein
MQIEAVYNDGKLEFPPHIRFVRNRFRVLVEVPDQDVVHSQKSDAGSHEQQLNLSPERQSTRERLNRIVGPARGKIGSIQPDEVKAIWRRHLEDKYCGK